MGPVILITAVYELDGQWIIGRRSGGLPWTSKQVPGELAFFRQTTTPGIVCFGRTTVKENQALWRLPGRKTYVFTRNGSTEESSTGLYVSNLDELLRREELDHNQDDPIDPIFIAGGASLYESLMDQCDFAYVSFVKLTKPPTGGPWVNFPRAAFERRFKSRPKLQHESPHFTSFLYSHG